MTLIFVVPPIFINNLVEFIDIYYFINTSRKAFISNSSNKINLIIAITFATVLSYTRLLSSKRNLPVFRMWPASPHSIQQGGSFFIKSRSMLPAQADKNKGEDTEVPSPPDYSFRQCNSLI